MRPCEALNILYSFCFTVCLRTVSLQVPGGTTHPCSKPIVGLTFENSYKVIDGKKDREKADHYA